MRTRAGPTQCRGRAIRSRRIGMQRAAMVSPCMAQTIHIVDILLRTPNVVHLSSGPTASCARCVTIAHSGGACSELFPWSRRQHTIRLVEVNVHVRSMTKSGEGVCIECRTESGLLIELALRVPILDDSVLAHIQKGAWSKPPHTSPPRTRLATR